MTDNELKVHLVPIREYLQECWKAWASEKNKPENADGKNMCRFTAAFLARLLGKPWRAVGGGCMYDFAGNRVISVGGFFDGETWQPHFWITDGKRIIDLTAHQFGAEPIVITTVDDPRYDANFIEPFVKEALSHVRARTRQWVREYEMAQQAEEMLLTA